MNTKPLTELLDAFLDHLRTRRFSAYTIKQNGYGNQQFLRWLAEAQGVRAPEQLRRSHLETGRDP